MGREEGGGGRTSTRGGNARRDEGKIEQVRKRGGERESKTKSARERESEQARESGSKSEGDERMKE